MSNLLSFSLVYENVPFEGLYEFAEGEEATQISPAWPDSVYIVAIMVRGTSFNLLELLDTDVVLHMEDKILKRNHQ